jgi:hypothetical protein
MTEGRRPLLNPLRSSSAKNLTGQAEVGRPEGDDGRKDREFSGSESVSVCF